MRRTEETPARPPTCTASMQLGPALSQVTGGDRSKGVYSASSLHGRVAVWGSAMFERRARLAGAVEGPTEHAGLSLCNVFADPATLTLDALPAPLVWKAKPCLGRCTPPNWRLACQPGPFPPPQHLTTVQSPAQQRTRTPGHNAPPPPASPPRAHPRSTHGTGQSTLLHSQPAAGSQMSSSSGTSGVGAPGSSQRCLRSRRRLPASWSIVYSSYPSASPAGCVRACARAGVDGVCACVCVWWRGGGGGGWAQGSRSTQQGHECALLLF